MARARIAATVIAALVLAGLPGCGSSGEPADETLTRAQFVNRANAICNKAREQALATAATDNPVQEGVLPALERGVQKLDELLLPSESTNLDGLVAALRRDVERAMRADIADLPELEDQFEQSAQLARKLGVTGCAFA